MSDTHVGSVVVSALPACTVSFARGCSAAGDGGRNQDTKIFTSSLPVQPARHGRNSQLSLEGQSVV